MNRYGRVQERIEAESDHRPVEWDPSGGVTGLQESMMRMGLGGAATYPERPGVMDCDHYMRTGYCGFGSRCRFNHPRDRDRVVSAMRFEGDQYPERPGEPVCQFFMKTGTCKFGVSCKFHHPKNGSGPGRQVPLNVLGYPLRPDASECSYYLKTGQCKFGVTCKFHHPQPAGMSVPSSAPSFYPAVQSSVPTPKQYGESSTQWEVDRTLLPGSYVQGSYGPMLMSSGVVPVPGWTSYTGSSSSVPAGGESTVLPYSQLFPSYANPSGGQVGQTFPERPGEPECQYYLRTGDCKYGSSCKYHHPKQWIAPSANYALSPMGLPLRPGSQPCRFYIQTGYCKFGSTCKFDHPLDSMGYNFIPQSPTNIQMPQYPMQPTPPFSTTSEPNPARSSEQQPYSSEQLYPRITSSSSSGVVLLPHIQVKQQGN